MILIMIRKLEKKASMVSYMHAWCKKDNDIYFVNEWYIHNSRSYYDNNRVLQQYRVRNYNYKHYYKT